MKNTFKFGLTVTAALVLAACSSSNDNGAAIAAQQQQAAQQAAAKAAAEKAKAEAAAKAAAEKAKAEAAKTAQQTGNTATKAGTTSERLDGNQGSQTNTGAATVAPNYATYGHKLIKKNNSDNDLNIGENGKKTSSSTGGADESSIRLHDSLNNFVVARSDTESGLVGYLEDFDFRGNNAANSAQGKGKFTLTHIHLDERDTATAATTARAADFDPATKTAKKGTKTGEALVFEQGRKNYISTNDTLTGTDTQVTNKVGGSAVTKNVVEGRDLEGSVAEVYGFRTFVDGNSELGKDKNATNKTFTNADIATANAPFLAKDAAGEYTVAGQLKDVQYGRVTSRLSGLTKADGSELRDGLLLNEGTKYQNQTKVVSYGKFTNGVDAKGSENSYFYRGVNESSAQSVAALKGLYFAPNAKDTTLTYQGHAVTYGFTHQAPAVSSDVKAAEQSVYARKAQLPVLVSGTHVQAKVNLADNSVTGSLYDVWNVTKLGETKGIDQTANIATFQGTLSAQGEIVGTSTRTADKAAGTLNANLFGNNAIGDQAGRELGGAIASKATDAANSWGAAFGAKVQNTLYVAPTKPAPVVPVEKNPWSKGTQAKAK